MGYYITRDSNGKPLSVSGKVQDLEEDGAEIIEPPTQWREDLIAVVNNDGWDAAAYCHSTREFVRFTMGRNDRTVTWMIYKYAKILSGYQEYLNYTDDLPID